MNLKDLHIDGSWTLFLDRDGVINRRIINGYVKSIGDFDILQGVLEAINRLSQVFGRIIIVTNQQGIGKGLMTETDLDEIHKFLKDRTEKAGGRIDAIYHASNLAEEKSKMRKPGIGMAIKAKKDFPDIDFQKSIMLGDSEIDMEFGRRTGMITIFIGEMDKTIEKSADFTFDSLSDFSNTLDKTI
jgi:histidinol-phosphate phosphatase family protein